MGVGVGEGVGVGVWCGCRCVVCVLVCVTTPPSTYSLTQVEYVMLNGHDWRDFALSAERQSRLRQITLAAQRVGVRLGADAAIAITQQVVCVCERG